MVADLRRRNDKLGCCFQNCNSFVLQQYQNLVNFKGKGSVVVLNSFQVFKRVYGVVLSAKNTIIPNVEQIAMLKPFLPKFC